MRLTFVAAALDRGGAERHTLELASALSARGHSCEVVAMQPARDDRWMRSLTDAFHSTRLTGVKELLQHVFHNGIAHERFAPGVRARWRATTRAALDLRNDDYVLGCCAQLRPEKNHAQLIDAVIALRGEAIPARALIVGDMVDRYEALFESLSRARASHTSSAAPGWVVR